MRESYDFNVSIRTLKKELPETSQIGIGDEACLFNIKYNGIDDKFSKPIRLVGNVMVFCVKGSVHMSVNLNEYDVKEGCLVVLTDQDIVKVEKGSDDDIRDLHWVVIAMSQNFLTNLRVDFRKILSEGVALIETPVLHLDQNIRGYFEDYLKLIGKLANSELPMYKDAVRSLISSMVSIAAGQWIADINRLRDEKVVKLNSRSEHKALTFRQFIKLVSENYTQQRQVIFYADQLCMSPKYLSKLVKDVSGKSAMPLLTLNELEQASALFRGKCGNALCRRLMRMLSIDKVNDLYDHNSSVTGPDFAEAVLEDIGVKYEVLNNNVLKQLPDGPFITISNHPYGHIDGVMLVDLFGHIRPDFKVMVNKFLGRIENLKDNFICVTPTGTERTGATKESIQGIKEAVVHIRSGGVLGLFPSGAVSDLSMKDKCIRDREWQEPVIRLIRKLNVPVVPVHFLDRNSDFYYSLGLLDWKVRLLRLPAEVFNKRGKVTRISLGEIILPEQLQKYEDIDELRDYLRNKVYNQQ